MYLRSLTLTCRVFHLWQSYRAALDRLKHDESPFHMTVRMASWAPSGDALKRISTPTCGALYQALRNSLPRSSTLGWRISPMICAPGNGTPSSVGCGLGRVSISATGSSLHRYNMSVPLTTRRSMSRRATAVPAAALKGEGGTADKSSSEESQTGGFIGEIGADGSTQGKHACLSRCQSRRHDYVPRVWRETLHQYGPAWGRYWWQNLKRPMSCLHRSISSYL